MTKTELDTILTNHKLWIKDNIRGRRADLQGADLRGADLRGAYLVGADLRRAYGIIRIENQYQYQCYGYYFKNELRVRLGCYDRTIEEWDNDFWNNEKEFPQDSPQGKNRLFNYNCIKQWLIENKQQIKEQK
jgi:hypothetical protein